VGLILRSVSANSLTRGGFFSLATTKEEFMFGRTKRAIYMHQIDGFGELTTIPVERYIERSLLMGGTVCVTEDTDTCICPWLQENGLAPDELIRVPGRCMFSTLSAGGPLLEDLKQRLQDGARLQFFHPTRLESDFLRAAGLDWKHTMSCEPAIAHRLGNKAYLRRVSDSLQGAGAFPKHIILAEGWNLTDLDYAIRRLEPRGDQVGRWHVLVKPVDLAGGDGICRTSSALFRKFADRFMGREVIVEQEIVNRESLSAQWFMQAGDPVYVGTSLQMHDGFVHQGELLSSGDDVVSADVSRALRALTQPLVQHAVQLGYSGVLAFDAVRDTRSGKLYLLDADARATSATYCYAVAARLGMKAWGMANKIIEPSRWIDTYSRARGILGYGLMFRRQRGTGVIPYMVGALRHDRLRRIGLMAIEQDVSQAGALLEEAESRLTA